KLCGMCDETLHPRELVREFGPGLRVAVRRVERRDNDAIHRSLQVAALRIGGITRESSLRHDRLAATPENGDPVPGLFSAPRRAVGCLLDCGSGKLGIRRLQLLQRDHVGLGYTQPVQEIGEALVDVVDVEGRDLHCTARRSARLAWY